MKANTRRDTQPEVAVRRLLHADGLRFRVDYPVGTSERPIRADIAFPARKLAIFVDGCFWHGCPEHATMPRKNRDYWEPKLERNRERDARQTVLLEEAGWQVARFWTHVPPEEISRAIEDLLARTGAAESCEPPRRAARSNEIELSSTARRGAARARRGGSAR
jgi:DNA mismatch endonuclease (patch repair protein)